MTEARKPWVGDQVHDASTNREGVVTDVRSGVFELRPVRQYWGRIWTVSDPGELTVTVPRQERTD